MDRKKSTSPIKSKNCKISQPYKTPPSFLINSIDSSSQSLKFSDKSVIEEETTCLTKYPLKTLSYENIAEAKAISQKTVVEYFDSSFCLDGNFKIFKTVVEMRNQVLRFEKGLNRNRESIEALEFENNLLNAKKVNIQGKLKERLDRIRRSRRSFNCCFF